MLGLRAAWRRVAAAPLLTASKFSAGYIPMTVTAQFHAASVVLTGATSEVPAAAPDATPKADAVTADADAKDEFANRPPEDEIAVVTAYFEMIASYWSGNKKVGPLLGRIDRLQDPRNL